MTAHGKHEPKRTHHELLRGAAKAYAEHHAMLATVAADHEAKRAQEDERAAILATLRHGASAQ